MKKVKVVVTAQAKKPKPMTSKMPLEKDLDLVKKIREGDYNAKRDAIKEAVRSNETETVPALIEALVHEFGDCSDNEGKFEEEIANAISSISYSKDHQDLVLKMFISEDVNERAVAARIIGLWKEPKCLEDVMVGLVDENILVVSESAMAIEAIAKNGNDCKRAEELLFLALRENGDTITRELIKDALSSIGVSRDIIDKEIEISDLTSPEEFTYNLVMHVVGDLREKVKDEFVRVTGKQADDDLLKRVGIFIRMHKLRDPKEIVKKYLSENSEN